MALTANAPRVFESGIDPMFIELGVKASTTIYEGAAVSDEAGGGTVDNLAGGESFLGFAERKADNGSGTAGAIRCQIRTKGVVKNLPVTGVTGITDVTVTVYATDSGTFTLTASGAASVGKVVRFVATGYADVYFEGVTARSI